MSANARINAGKFYDAYKEQCTSSNEIYGFSAKVIEFPLHPEPVNEQLPDEALIMSNKIDRGLLEEINQILPGDYNADLSILANTLSDRSNDIQWLKKFISHYLACYENIKRFDLYNILSIEKEKLTIHFPDNYTRYCNEAGANHPLDRHKKIAVLTKAFLDASPFICDIEKALALIQSGESILRVLTYPNEVLAIDICTIILTAWGIYHTKDKDYKFVYPVNVYPYTKYTTNASFDYELFLLYRKYRIQGKIGTNTLPLYQMSQIYFLLEMGCDIGKYGRSDQYYGTAHSIHKPSVYALSPRNILEPSERNDERSFGQMDFTKKIKENVNILEWLKQNPEQVIIFTNTRYDRESGETIGDIVTTLTYDEYINNGLYPLPSNVYVLKGALVSADNR